ncbi:MAG: triose-phosphate isomerase [Halioglobus sp.]|nr:triose-phosphate isomerase [Halioglobus sp.]
MRQPLVVANWKMNGSRASVASLLDALLEAPPVAGVDVAICPAHVHLAQAVARCEGSALEVGAQDCSHAQSGAYTGEVAAQMLADLGCHRVILGHSERRQYHSETDVLIAAKLNAAVVAGLAPILCVGETRAQREAGEAEAIVDAQLQGALLEQENLKGLVVAYEPVWAIGTGLTATPEQAREMHGYIRESLGRIEGIDAETTPIVYGGSVKADNAASLFEQLDIDGALVGGASLVAEEFLAIVAAAVR